MNHMSTYLVEPVCPASIAHTREVALVAGHAKQRIPDESVRVVALAERKGEAAWEQA